MSIFFTPNSSHLQALLYLKGKKIICQRHPYLRLVHNLTSKWHYPHCEIQNREMMVKLTCLSCCQRVTKLLECFHVEKQSIKHDSYQDSIYYIYCQVVSICLSKSSAVLLSALLAFLAESCLSRNNYVPIYYFYVEMFGHFSSQKQLQFHRCCCIFR